MNDAWLFLGGFLFLFVLWIYSGGPNNPISFSGPYITPITRPDSVQTGYGPSANSYISSANPNPSPAPTSPNPAGDPVSSTYAGQVIIGYSDTRTSDPRSEYIVLHLTSGTNVDVTGWQLVSSRSGTRVVIPQDSRSTSSSKADIVLSSNYRDAYIVTGSRASDSLKDSSSSAWLAYLGQNKGIWDDASDTITLLDRAGKPVDQYSY